MTILKALKPYRLRRWRVGQPPECLFLFTCARPGRTSKPSSADVDISDDLVHRWVAGLPGPKTAIVSLLGRKPDGLSEFSFYSFYGGFDLASNNPGRLAFQEWLDRFHGDRSILLRERPTCDYKPIPLETLVAIQSDVLELASAGRTVLVIDSGGQTRTGQACSHMGAVEITGQSP
jgi:hypothetical protein